MADISTTTKITIRHQRLSWLSFPRLAIGVSLEAIANLMVNAFTMVYVDPYTSRRRQPKFAPDDDLDGRDPNW
jgi:hypothetical protein